MQANQSRTERIDIRASLRAKQLLQRAAAARHKSVSEFLLEAGLAAAEETLADQRHFMLDEERWAEFQQALDRPVQDKPRLAELLTRRSVLE